MTRDKVPYETGIARYNEISRGPIRGDDSGMFKMLLHREDGRLLGCHCIGSGATELIHVGQAVIGLGGGLDYFLKTVFNYPTLAECYKVAAYNVANKLALVRHATGSVAPPVLDEAPDIVAPVGSGVRYNGNTESSCEALEDSGISTSMPVSGVRADHP